jgi:hypothetical protein
MSLVFKGLSGASKSVTQSRNLRKSQNQRLVWSGSGVVSGCSFSRPSIAAPLSKRYENGSIGNGRRTWTMRMLGRRSEW